MASITNAGQATTTTATGIHAAPPSTTNMGTTTGTAASMLLGPSASMPLPGPSMPLAMPLPMASTGPSMPLPVASTMSLPMASSTAPAQAQTTVDNSNTIINNFPFDTEINKYINTICINIYNIM